MTALPRRHRDALAAAVAVARSLPAGVGRDVRSLADALYAQWYTRLRTPKPTGWPSGLPFVTRLRQAFSHAARGRGCRSLTEVAACETLVEDCGYWSVQSPIFALTSSPQASSETGDAMRRIYWNAVQTGTPALVHDLTAVLPAGFWWSLKVPLTPDGFLRPDAVVLYVDADAWPRALSLVSSVAARHRRHLHPDVPPLTSWIDAGVASARDPGVPGESFGLALCRRVAEILAGSPGARTDASRLAAGLFPPTTGRRSARPGRRRPRRPDG